MAVANCHGGVACVLSVTNAEPLHLCVIRWLAEHSQGWLMLANHHSAHWPRWSVTWPESVGCRCSGFYLSDPDTAVHTGICETELLTTLFYPQVGFSTSNKITQICLILVNLWYSTQNKQDSQMINQRSIGIFYVVSSGNAFSHNQGRVSILGPEFQVWDSRTDILSISCVIDWWGFKIGSSKGLVPPDNKPLPEPMLTHIWYGITMPQSVYKKVTVEVNTLKSKFHFDKNMT